MKIVNIILTSQNGGAEQVFVDYSAVLKNLGHEVLAITKTDAPYAHKVSELGIKVVKIKNNFGDYDFFAVREIKKILEEFNADAVFAHVGRSMVLVRKAIKKIKNKKIFLIAVNHSMNVKRSIGADIILSVNKEIFFRTVDLGQDQDRSFVIPNAVNLGDAVLDIPKIDLSKKDVITIGAMGRLDKSKGFRYAVKAIRELEKICEEEKINKKFILKISGSGKREKYLRSLIKELNLEDKVEFLGWTKNKKEFFDGIDIFCLTSQRETFGLVLLEAMKYHKPVISTDADGPKEIIRNEIDGLLISLEPLTNTEIRLAQAIIKMINESELMNKMIENSFVRLREKFSYEMLQKRIAEIVGKI